MVGDAGRGLLEIFNGAIVAVDFSANPGTGDLNLGNAADSQGTTVVSGRGSQLRMGDDTTVGVNGTGILRIENEGYVLGTNGVGTDLFTVGPLGRIELAGGQLQTEVLTNDGVILGSGRIDNEGTIVNSGTGRIEVGNADRLVVNAPVTNQGIDASRRRPSAVPDDGVWLRQHSRNARFDGWHQ
jgi:T5SS/PEP-CTERM-associated repeat protein